MVEVVAVVRNKKIMKTFKDLKFLPHSMMAVGTQARITLNGCKISVITGAAGMYAGTGTYEMMSDRCKSSDGIRGWLTPEQITRHMIYIQKNPLK